MSKFIEVTIDGNKHFIAVAAIKAIKQDADGGAVIFFTSIDPRWVCADESYEEVKRLIWDAE